MIGGFALWGGFILETPAGIIYSAGDTGYQDGKIFTEIRKRCGAPRVAILPIGAYEPALVHEVAAHRSGAGHPDRHRLAARTISVGCPLGLSLPDESPMSRGDGNPAMSARRKTISASKRATANLTAQPFFPGDIWGGLPEHQSNCFPSQIRRQQPQKQMLPAFPTN